MRIISDDSGYKWTVSIADDYVNIDAAALLDREAAIDLGRALLALDRRAVTSTNSLKE